MSAEIETARRAARILPRLECGIAHCREPQHRSGMCAAHYHRWERTGSPYPVEGDPTIVSGQEAAKLIGVTYRRLDYWLTAHELLGAEAALTGSGNARQIARLRLPLLDVYARLVELGMKPSAATRLSHQQRLRAVGALRSITRGRPRRRTR